MSKEKTLNIYQRINKVMADVEYIQKGEKRVNNQYRFVSHDQVTGRLHEPLTRYGIVMVPSVTGHAINGNRTEIMVNVRFVNIDDPQDFVSMDCIGYGIDPSDKGPGKAISYACKYALLKMFCLETGDDPDQDQDTVHKADPIINEKDARILDELLLQLDQPTVLAIKKNLLDLYEVDNYSRLPAESFFKAKASLNDKIIAQMKNKKAAMPYTEEMAS